ncbi:MAG: hypothetical protein HFF37_04285 [Coprobacillus sp.]|nr:hypothetical protein [Coprobacillus sp.]
MVHPIALDSLAVLLVAPLTESLTPDEQAILGAFLNVLGDLLSLNSAYISYAQSQNNNDNEDNNEYDIIQKSIEKIQDELEKVKTKQKDS